MHFVLSCSRVAAVMLAAVSGPVVTDAEEAATVFAEVDGVIAAEAEDFFGQELTEVRAWHLVTKDHTPEAGRDLDPNHAADASGGAYLEVLPDTRTNHDETLVRGENFSNVPGKLAVLHYRVQVDTPGRWYVWARIFSTNSEDNGLHVGLNGTWPESGQRMQWTEKNHWAWGSKQRTQEVHTGIPHLLYLDINEPGEHVISFSMREDGTEFDKWMMTQEQLDAVEGVGPPVHTLDR